MPRRAVLPDNVPACHVMIRQLEDRVDELESDVKSLKRALFGSQRERFVSGNANETSGRNASHPSLLTAPLAANTGDQPPAAASDSPASDSGLQPETRRRTSLGRRPRQLDAAIIREQILHRLQEEDVPAKLWNDPRARRFFRFVREELEIQRPALKVFEHYEEVLTVDDLRTETTRFVTARTPNPVLDRCYAGPELLATLAASRFADHIPYYREEDILARQQVTIGRATQWRWMRKLSALLLPLVELMRQRTRKSHVMGIDETPIAQLCPGSEDAGTRSVYLYALYGDASQPYSCFEYASRKTEVNVRRIVGDFCGVLQSDAYICYSLVAASRSADIIPVGCWAHARRKFEPLVKEGPHPQATWVLERIQRIYDIEHRAGLMNDAERLALRQAESRPIVEEIARWLDERSRSEMPQSPLRKGVSYLWSRWPMFTRFLEDGSIPVDNNRTEASIKGPVMGKKNWLFFGNEAAGQTAAIMYSLTMTCRRHNIDVVAYLIDVLRRIRKTPTSQLAELLPDRWIEAHAEARVMQRVRESHAAATRKRERRQQRRLAVPTG